MAPARTVGGASRADALILISVTLFGARRASHNIFQTAAGARLRTRMCAARLSRLQA